MGNRKRPAIGQQERKCRNTSKKYFINKLKAQNNTNNGKNMILL